MPVTVIDTMEDGTPRCRRVLYPSRWFTGQCKKPRGHKGSHLKELIKE